MENTSDMWWMFNLKTFSAVLILTLAGYNCDSSGLSTNSGPHGVGINFKFPVIAGFNTTFTCTSLCIPQCTYTWSVNNGPQINGDKITWTPDGLDSVLEITCTARNPDTGNTKTHTFIETIQNRVSVQASPPHSLPALNQSHSLVCQGAKPGLTVVWYINGKTVTPGDRIRLLDSNATLHFDSLATSDGGFYQCKAVVTQQGNSAYSLGYLLSFDHWNVSISGPDRVWPGTQSTFTCVTSCTINVDCTTKWQFRSGFPVGTYFSANGNVLKWTPSLPGTFQNFTCVAQNEAAQLSAEATKTVAVVGIPVSGLDMMQFNGLIGLAVCLGALLIGI